LFTRSGRCFIFGRKMLFKSGLWCRFIFIRFPFSVGLRSFLFLTVLSRLIDAFISFSWSLFRQHQQSLSVTFSSWFFSLFLPLSKTRTRFSCPILRKLSLSETLDFIPPHSGPFIFWPNCSELLRFFSWNALHLLCLPKGGTANFRSFVRFQRFYPVVQCCMDWCKKGQNCRWNFQIILFSVTYHWF
jgi:hypothetical protein